MKNILFLILAFFMSMSGFASCWPVDNSSCPTTDCPLGSFMGDDGRCYGCNSSEDVDIRCIGKTAAAERCPNRIFPGKGCGEFISRLCLKNTCSPGTFMGDDGRCYSCNEEKSIDINCIGQETAKKACLNRVVEECGNNLLFIKCPNGSKRKEGSSICYKDGEFHAYSCSY